jgi:hypothetical protein
MWSEVAGMARWSIEFGDSTTEAGANSGTDFSISRWDDVGNYLGIVIKINRATGVVDFSVPPTVAGAPMAMQSKVDELEATVTTLMRRIEILEGIVAAPQKSSPTE